MRPSAWREYLTDYPDPTWSHRLVHDIIHGVDIGYRGSRRLRVTGPNFVEGDAERKAISASLTEDAALHRIIGPFAASPFPFFRCSPLKTVEKRGKPGTFRIIHHLSHPHDRSINTFTADWPCRLSRFDQAVAIVRHLGAGCFMAKVDIQAAYRAVPIRPADWPLLGMQWDGQFWFHTSLPFGLRSSCHLWERYATAAQWIATNVVFIKWILHYVDDFLLAERTRALCSSNLILFQRLLQHLGLPEATEKTVEPCTRILYLGVLIDSVQMTVRLDQERVTRIRALLSEWVARSVCSLRQLQSLVGILSWASLVVRPGRTFLQYMRDLITQHAGVSTSPSLLTIQLGPDFYDDLQWWLRFMTEWNGISLLPDRDWMDSADTLQPHTDACGEGFAAVVGTHWFHQRWTAEQQSMAQDSDMSRDSMPWKELYAIVAAAATWGPLWSRKRVVFWSDCQPVVQALTKGASRTGRMMQLIRSLHFYAAKYSFVYRAQHIAGVNNTIADELSRVHDVSQLSPTCRSAIDPSPTIPALPHIPL